MNRLEVTAADGSYHVVIGRGLLARAAGLIPEEARRAEVVACVSDASVAALHGDALAAGLHELPARLERFTVEPGERSKSVAGVEALWRWMAGIGLHRGDAVIALGGGVVGDLAGFAAATFHRGITLIQVPTTLLAQVDAAIGGKTAIDLPEGKNLVGAFHAPRVVLADTDTLATVPQHAFATGMAEVVKHGLIAPGGLLQRLRADAEAIAARDPDALRDLVTEAAAVKIAIVRADEHERGVRAHLNYGHTLGHALEVLGAYGELTHGEAVAVGMMFAANLARALGFEDLVDVHRDAIAAVGLPTKGAGYPFEQVADAWRADKKYDHGVRFVLLESLGRPLVTGDVEEAALRSAYEAVR